MGVTGIGVTPAIGFSPVTTSSTGSDVAEVPAAATAWTLRECRPAADKTHDQRKGKNAKE